jgi:hypothetical protein
VIALHHIPKKGDRIFHNYRKAIAYPQTAIPAERFAIALPHPKKANCLQQRWRYRPLNPQT